MENGALKDVSRKRLAKEADLQRWIAGNPQIIGLQLLVIGREIPTGFGRIDILGLDEEGNLIIVECKRDRTPRDVIAQLLDYGSWVAALSTRQVHDIANARLSSPLAKAFMERFDTALPEALNSSHSLIIVATEFDPSSRRIVEYLAEVHKLSINAVFFSSFNHQGKDLLAIEWLLDQEAVVERAEARTAAPWTGINYVNVGESKDRRWEDMRKFGFVSAGGGQKYAGALQRLAIGDIVAAYQKRTGYVGLGRVISAALPVDSYLIDGQPVSTVTLAAPDFLHDKDDLNLCEFIVGIHWFKTYPLDEAKTFPGAFANQNVVCKLRDPATLSFLTECFPVPTSNEAVK